MLKKIAWYFAGFLAVFFIILLALPFFFKDQIQKKIDEELQKSIQAEVHFDLDKFGLSFIRNFPNVSVSVQDFGIIGQENFAGDTLLSVKYVNVAVDIWSVLFGQQMQVKSIYVDSPYIQGLVKSNGEANWDIFAASSEDSSATEEETTPEESPTEFNIGIKRWEIRDARIHFLDQSQGIVFKLDDLDHEGRGDFDQEVFDLSTQTNIAAILAEYGGTNYLNQQSFKADVVLNMNLPQQKYTFKENEIQLNDFVFGFDGWVQLDSNNTQMDLTYAAKETSFKNLLSLVPGMYTESFASLKSSGNLQFDGYAKGVYSESQIPGFAFNLQVKEGMFQYPDLPVPVNHVNLSLKTKIPQDQIHALTLDLDKFHMDMGENPVDLTAHIKGIQDPFIQANIRSKINLADLTKIFPMEGLALQGLFTAQAKVNGQYQEKSQKLPSIQATLGLKNGYVKSDQFPEALEKVTFLTHVTNKSGNYPDTHIEVDTFHMVLDQETFALHAMVEDLEEMRYDIKAKGRINLEKALHYYPLEGYEDTELKGNIYADMETQGSVAKLVAGQYSDLPARGILQIRNFDYRSPELLPQGLKIQQANAFFDPREIKLENMEGFLGKSDIKLRGKIQNYIDYVFQPQATLKGNMQFESRRFDLNEWLVVETEEESNSTSTPVENPSPSPGDTLTLAGATQIPRNIDFVLDSKLDKVSYGTLDLDNLSGQILIKDGTIRLNQLLFGTLGGKFKANGTYDTRDVEKPSYAMDFQIEELPLSQLYDYVVLDSPESNLMSQKISGAFNTLFKIQGRLDQDLMPLLDESVSGSLDAAVRQAEIQDAPALKKVASFTNLKGLDKFSFKDVIVKGNIREGIVEYEPFDVQAGDYKMNVSGTTSLTGDLNLLLKLDVPLGDIGQLARTTLATLTKKNLSDAESLEVSYRVVGPMSKPTYELVGGASQGGLKDIAKEKVKELVDDKVGDPVKDKIQEKLGLKEEGEDSELSENVMKEAEARAEQIRSEGKNAAQTIREEADRTYKKAMEAASKQGLLTRKAAELAAKKAKDLAYKRASDVENTANQKADQIIEEARKKTGSTN